MNFEYITSEIREDIGIVTINDPKTLNSVNSKMLHELAEKLKEYDQKKQVKVIVLKGIDKSFAAGIDVKELAANIDDAKNIIQNMQVDFNSINNTQKPLIAAVSGFALGIGCELALCCDIILATDDARFGLPELSIGLLPCFNGCRLLATRIGKAKAMDMILSGKAMSATEAESIGLISRIIAPESLEEEYIKLARRIALLPQNTIFAAKKIINSYFMSSWDSSENLCSLNSVESDEFKRILMSYASPKHSNNQNM